jgi:hypothetical protein
MRSLALACLALGACARPPEAAANRPRSLNDCLLVAAQKPAPEAILASERICREVFSNAGAATHGLGGSLYYLAGTGKCLHAEIRPDGSVEGGFGLCSEQARFERDASGNLFFTCLLPTTGEPPGVYRVTESAEQLALHAVRAPGSGLPAEWAVSRTLAACSLATTDEDRNLASTLAERADAEWLDLPLAAWKSGQGGKPRRWTPSRN